MRYLTLLTLFSLPVLAWFDAVPDWLDRESHQLVMDLNSGIGQSQNPNFLKAEYGDGEMMLYYRQVNGDRLGAFGAVVENHAQETIYSFCTSAYYRKRLELGMVYRHLYQDDTGNISQEIRIDRYSCLQSQRF
ncbi:hypothetical protein [Ferrimonas sp.]|uniref:hypothetical protein n=1 Tax=Ferrimonas sp. TaxID=2080861 RepID=UPI003A9007A3